MLETIRSKLVYYDIIGDIKFYCSREGLKILSRRRSKWQREAFRYF